MTDAEIKQFVKDIPKRKRITMQSWNRIFNFAKYVAGITTASNQHFPGWLTLHPEETKFSVNIRRVLDQLPAIQATRQKRVQAIEEDHCATMHARPGDPDSPKIIVRDEKGNLCFTVDGTRAKDAAIDELNKREDIEIEACYTSEIPKLSKDEVELFSGFVIDPEDVESILKLREETTVPAVIVNQSSNGADRESVIV